MPSKRDLNPRPVDRKSNVLPVAIKVIISVCTFHFAMHTETNILPFFFQWLACSRSAVRFF